MQPRQESRTPTIALEELALRLQRRADVDRNTTEGSVLKSLEIAVLAFNLEISAGAVRAPNETTRTTASPAHVWYQGRDGTIVYSIHGSPFVYVAEAHSQTPEQQAASVHAFARWDHKETLHHD